MKKMTLARTGLTDGDYEEVRKIVDEILTKHGIESIDGFEDDSDGVYNYLIFRDLNDDQDRFDGTIELTVDLDGTTCLSHYTTRTTAKDGFLIRVSDEIEEAVQKYLREK